MGRSFECLRYCVNHDRTKAHKGHTEKNIIIRNYGINNSYYYDFNNELLIRNRVSHDFRTALLAVVRYVKMKTVEKPHGGSRGSNRSPVLPLWRQAICSSDWALEGEICAQFMILSSGDVMKEGSVGLADLSITWTDRTVRQCESTGTGLQSEQTWPTLSVWVLFFHPTTCCTSRRIVLPIILLKALTVLGVSQARRLSNGQDSNNTDALHVHSIKSPFG